MTKTSIERAVAQIFLVAVFLIGILYAQSFPFRAKIYPMTVCVAGFLLTTAALITTVINARRARGAPVPEHPVEYDMTARLRKSTIYLAWIIGYFALIYLFGFLASTIVFVVAFWIIVGRMKPHVAVICAAALIGLLLLGEHTIGVEWPEGVLWSLNL